MDRRNRILLSFIGGIIVGFVACYFWIGDRVVSVDLMEEDTRIPESSDTEDTRRPNLGGESDETSGIPESGAGMMRIGANAIAVLEQRPGTSVVISAVSLGETSWIAIHDNLDGASGSILGAKRLQAGEHTKVSVELLRATADGKPYIAMIHSDDGDGAFNYQDDVPVIGPDNRPIMMEFDVSSTASLEVPEVNI